MFHPHKSGLLCFFKETWICWGESGFAQFAHASFRFGLTFSFFGFLFFHLPLLGLCEGLSRLAFKKKTGFSCWLWWMLHNFERSTLLI